MAKIHLNTTKKIRKARLKAQQEATAIKRGFNVRAEEQRRR